MPLRGACVDSFNPHPPLLAGETLPDRRYRRGQTVSIHTRHYWRVKRYLAAENALIDTVVSIHTRHYWRVKHEARVWAYGRGEVSIHTRHYWRVKRPVGRKICIRRVFQSTPAITGG